MRKTGFSKDGKHQNPQIYIGLLVGLGGYAIGYDIFEGNIYEGNIYEGHTLIPFIEKISAKFNLNQPIVVADSGLLSNDNIKALEQKGYEYIIGARLKNEPDNVKKANPGNPVFRRSDHQDKQSWPNPANCELCNKPGGKR